MSPQNKAGLAFSSCISIASFNFDIRPSTRYYLANKEHKIQTNQVTYVRSQRCSVQSSDENLNSPSHHIMQPLMRCGFSKEGLCGGIYSPMCFFCFVFVCFFTFSLTKKKFFLMFLPLSKACRILILQPGTELPHSLRCVSMAS